MAFNPEQFLRAAFQPPEGQTLPTTKNPFIKPRVKVKHWKLHQAQWDDAKWASELEQKRNEEVNIENRFRVANTNLLTAGTTLLGTVLEDADGNPLSKAEKAAFDRNRMGAPSAATGLTKSYERSYGRRQGMELRRIAGVYTFFYGGVDDEQVKEILSGLFDDDIGACAEASQSLSKNLTQGQGNMLALSYERSYGRRQDDELRRIAGVYTFFYGGIDDKQVKEILAGLFEDSTGAYKEATDWISARRSEVQGNMLAFVRTASRCATEMASMQSKSGHHAARASSTSTPTSMRRQSRSESGSIDFGAIFYHPNKDATKPWRKFVRSKFVNLEMQVLECETLFANEHLAAEVQSTNNQMLFDH